MQSKKGSEKEMTDVVEQQVTTPTFNVGDRIRISTELITPQWDAETFEYKATRTFDFGEIESINDDGTVEVYWDSAGCTCNGTRTEKVEDLSEATEVEELLYRAAFRNAYERGVKDNQSELREALGLSE